MVLDSGGSAFYLRSFESPGDWEEVEQKSNDDGTESKKMKAREK
jgi:hypothetical protein